MGAGGFGDRRLLGWLEVGVGVVTTLRRRVDDGVDVAAGTSTSMSCGGAGCCCRVSCCCCC